jgi:hypothetical protein
MDGDLGTARNFHAVKLGEDVEDAWHSVETSEYTVLLGNERGAGDLVGVDAGVGGRVEISAIFKESVLQQRGDTTIVPVHLDQFQSSAFRVPQVNPSSR